MAEIDYREMRTNLTNQAQKLYSEWQQTLGAIQMIDHILTSQGPVEVPAPAEAQSTGDEAV
jgi:hypothetical protein